MTNTTLPDEVLKTDVLGRVRTPKARREALLEEFARRGVSGKNFAALVVVNYQIFASWAVSPAGEETGGAGVRGFAIGDEGRRAVVLHERQPHDQAAKNRGVENQPHAGALKARVGWDGEFHRKVEG